MLVSAVTKMIDIRSNGIPALAISLVVNKPVEWTIALGGVPTGIIKPQLVAIAIGAINNIGFNPIEDASEAAIGSNSAAVAVLLIISLGKIANITKTNNMTKQFAP